MKSSHFKLGLCIAFLATIHSDYNKLPITTIAGYDHSSGMYFIEHPQGNLLEELLKDHACREKVELYENDNMHTKTYLVVDESDLDAVDFDNLPKNIPLDLRLKAALEAKNEAYIGKLVLKGELACVARKSYEALQTEHELALDVVRSLCGFVAPAFTENGQTVLMRYIDPKATDPKKKFKFGMGTIIAEATKAALGKSDLVNLIMSLNVNALTQIPYQKLLDIAQKYQLNIEGVAEFMQNAKLTA